MGQPQFLSFVHATVGSGPRILSLAEHIIAWFIGWRGDTVAQLRIIDFYEVLIHPRLCLPWVWRKGESERNAKGGVKFPGSCQVLEY